MDARLVSAPKLILHEELGSTSVEAKHLFEAGEDMPCWVLTRLQTAGYGRRGRGWQQQRGDFAGSLLWPLGAGVLAQNPALASFAAAVSLDLALQSCGLAKEAISLKWPNDVRVDGAKIAGLLLELVEHSNRRALIIGIGVNMVSAPQVEAYPTTRLADHLLKDNPPAPEVFVKKLDHQLIRQLQLLNEDGFAAIRSAWAARAEGLGQRIQVSLPRETLVGIFEGIDQAGALILRSGGATQAITSGEIFFTSTAPNSC